MISISAAELSAKDQYKILSGSVIPRPIAWVMTQSRETGVINLAPFSLFTLVSKDLPLVSLSIMRQAGEQKDTALNLSQTGEGVIHLVDQSLLNEMNASSASLPREVSELTGTDLVTEPSQFVDVPALTLAKARYEVKLFQHLPITDPKTGEVLSDLFVLEVVAFHLAEEIYQAETGYIDGNALNPVARLAGPEYGILGETFNLARPN